MCPHPTNPHRLPQPHLLSEWQPSQDHYAADHHAQPTNAPGKASISERSARAPALSEKSPYPLSCRLTQTTGTVALATQLPPGGSGTRPKRALEANKPPPRAQRESPILSKASSARAGRVPRSPTVQQAHSNPNSPHRKRIKQSHPTDCLKKEPHEERTLGQPLSDQTPQAHRMNSPRSALNKTHTTTTAWLPLEIPAIPLRRAPRRVRSFRPCGRERAAWWFDQMRRIVETGADFCA